MKIHDLGVNTTPIFGNTHMAMGRNSLRLVCGVGVSLAQVTWPLVKFASTLSVEACEVISSGSWIETNVCDMHIVTYMYTRIYLYIYISI